jgi:hypothetical protein
MAKPAVDATAMIRNLAAPDCPIDRAAPPRGARTVSQRSRLKPGPGHRTLSPAIMADPEQLSEGRWKTLGWSVPPARGSCNLARAEKVVRGDRACGAHPRLRSSGRSDGCFRRGSGWKSLVSPAFSGEASRRASQNTNPALFRRRSSSTIILHNCSSVVVGCQPSFSRAFAGSPISSSTSAGR